MKNSFIKIPQSILKADIKTGSKLTYGLLLNRLQLSKKRNYCLDGVPFVYYSIENLARDLNCPEKSVRNYLEELQNEQIIQFHYNGFSKKRKIFLQEFFEESFLKISFDVLQYKITPNAKLLFALLVNCSEFQLKNSKKRTIHVFMSYLTSIIKCVSKTINNLINSLKKMNLVKEMAYIEEEKSYSIVLNSETSREDESSNKGQEELLEIQDKTVKQEKLENQVTMKENKNVLIDEFMEIRKYRKCIISYLKNLLIMKKQMLSYFWFRNFNKKYEGKSYYQEIPSSLYPDLFLKRVNRSLFLYLKRILA